MNFKRSSASRVPTYSVGFLRCEPGTVDRGAMRDYKLASEQTESLHVAGDVPLGLCFGGW